MLKPVNCPKKLVPFIIDEFPILFMICAMIRGVSKFSGIAELRHKESDRIKNIELGLNQIGIKTKSTNSSVNILTLSVVRRDGAITPFKADKISNAIKKAFLAQTKIRNNKNKDK